MKGSRSRVVSLVKHVIALIRVQFCRQIRASMGEVQKRLWRHNDSPAALLPTQRA